MKKNHFHIVQVSVLYGVYIILTFIEHYSGTNESITTQSTL